MSKNIKTLVCTNPDSIYKGILSDDVILRQKPVNFVFRPDSDDAIWPLKASYYDLIKDGWTQVENT